MNAQVTTLQDCITQVAQTLDDAALYFGHGTDNAYDEAVWICLAAIGDSPVSPRSQADRILQAAEIVAIHQLLAKRVETRKPTAYLTNRAWFGGLEFYVDERVLVPRSPIAELIDDEFLPWYEGPPPRRILDLCTGSGCIAIACARKFSDAVVDAGDLSADALAVAAINVERHQLEERVNLRQGNLLEPFVDQQYDLIVSNPPYVSHAEMDLLEEEFLAEPQMGFDGGTDGLDLVAQLLLHAKQHLREQGLLVIEVGSVEMTESRFPKIPFTWPDLRDGGTGIFALTAEQLEVISI